MGRWASLCPHRRTPRARPGWIDFDPAGAVCERTFANDIEAYLRRHDMDHVEALLKLRHSSVRFGDQKQRCLGGSVNRLQVVLVRDLDTVPIDGPLQRRHKKWHAEQSVAREAELAERSFLVRRRW